MRYLLFLLPLLLVSCCVADDKKIENLSVVSVSMHNCPPCEAMERDVWPHFDSRFVNKRKKTFDGKKYKVRYFPTTIVYRDGKEVARKGGYVSKKKMETWLQSLQ